MVDPRQLEAAIWSIADGRSTEADETLVALDERASVATLERLLDDLDDDLAVVRRTVHGDGRDQVVADFVETIDALRQVLGRYRPEVLAPRSGRDVRDARDADDELEDLEPDAVTLQASWANGKVVVWAAGRGTAPEGNDALADRLEAMGGPPLGWEVHPPVDLPDGERAEALAIPMKDALGWLVALDGGVGRDGAAPSLLWLAGVALEGVRQVALGSLVPQLRFADAPKGKPVDASVTWMPALVDRAAVDAYAASMPGAVVAAVRGTPVGVINDVIGSVVDAIVRQSTERMELPAAPPTANTPTDLVDTVIARMDGTAFRAHAGLTAEVARRLDQWAHMVVSPTRPRLVVHLEAPDSGGVWVLSVHAPAGKGKLVPIDEALKLDRGRRLVTGEWTRLVRLFPAFDRAAQRLRGQVALSQNEAWDFMTHVGPSLRLVGFDVRVPALSRRKATASLRLFAETPAGSVVGARQLSNVAWTVLFDDVELTAADIARLAREARPLVQSRGRWVEVDRVDLEKAAAALAEREHLTQLTGAEILRQSMGLDASGLAGGVVVHGESWANDLMHHASEAKGEIVTRPEGFRGELRTYQAEALAWIGFLDASELGGCLALDMGLGKTPTVLAHLARTKGKGTSLVVAPAAVVGNWANEAAKFAPDLNVVVHHGASRATPDALEHVIEKADVVVTTYATAVRDIDALCRTTWGRVVLDEAQAIKNPTSETAQQLRRLPAGMRLALTGTPIENGLGDLWAILDFTNPGLVGPRAAFITNLSGDGEAALKALNGILVFRRTKSEPEVAAELPDKIDELDHCSMTAEQIGLYQAVLDSLIVQTSSEVPGERKQGAILAAITALKQICNHPAAYRDDGRPLAGRSGKLARLEELVQQVFESGERILVFTHFATWGQRLATHLTEVTGVPIACYDGSLARGVRDRLVHEFQNGTGPGALVLSLKAGGTGLNLTAANHVVLYDRWWNPAIEDQARDRAWRIGQKKTVISHRLVCPGTVDERVEEVVAGKRHIAELVLAKSSSIADLDAGQLRLALGLRPDEMLTEDDDL
jgi:superfamily II DNA or RNA helicase